MLFLDFFSPFPTFFVFRDIHEKTLTPEIKTTKVSRNVLRSKINDHV